MSPDVTNVLFCGHCYTTYWTYCSRTPSNKRFFCPEVYQISG